MTELNTTNEIYHQYGDAFLAYKAKSLYDLIVSQGSALHLKVGATTPANCTSIVLLLESHKSLSAVQIAQKLEKSHQLISQRINKLEKLGIVMRNASDSDKRAKYISLTKPGLNDILKIKQACHIADKHFKKLYKELNINIGQAIDLMNETLQKLPLQNIDT